MPGGFNVSPARFLPVLRQVALDPARELGCVLGKTFGVGGKFLIPFRFELRAPLPGIPAAVDFIGNLKLGPGPVNGFPRQRDLIRAQGRAVAGSLALLVGRTQADNGIAAQESGPVGHCLRGADGLTHVVRVMAVNVGNHVPLVGLETLRHVLGKPAFHLAVDGDLITVVDDDELAQAQGARQRTGLVGNAFHQAAIADGGVGVVVDDIQAGAVELRGQGAFGDGHAHGIRQALAQGSGRGLYPGGIAILRVAGCFRMKLAEIPQFLHGQVVAGQVQDGIQQHGTVAVGHHEAVPVHPAGIGRVVPEEIVPQHFGDIRHAHRRAGVPGLGALHRVHTQCPDRIGELASGRNGYSPNRLRRKTPV